MYRTATYSSVLINQLQCSIFIGFTIVHIIHANIHTHTDGKKKISTDQFHSAEHRYLSQKEWAGLQSIKTVDHKQL